MKKFFSNFIYQSIFQVVKIVAPLITIPIVSHALGPENVGLYSYTQSIAQYFILLSGLGMALYGQRTIAQFRDNKIELSKKFWELELLSVTTTLVAFLIYIIIFLNNSNHVVYILQGLTIIAVAFDISWFFMGIEEFKLTSLRSLLINILTVILIYFFVNDENDTYIYISIQTLGILFSQLIMWPFLKNEIMWIKPKARFIKKHFVMCIQYFVPQIATTLYTNLNKTLLGVFRNNTEVAYFSNAFTIIIVIRTFISTIDTVLLPQLSNLSFKKDEKKILSILKVSLNMQFYFTIPAMFGIIAVAPKLVPWFYGDSFHPVIQLVQVMAVLIVIVPMGMSISRQWLIPIGNLKAYNISIFVGAVAGFVFNLILIPKFGALGATLSLIISEFFVAFTRSYDFIKTTKFKYEIKSFVIYGICSGIMLIFIVSSTNHMGSSALTSLIQIILGVIIYLSLTTLFRCNPVFKFIKEKKN